MNLDDIAQSSGFKNEKEMAQMVCEVDLTQTITFMRFDEWKRIDGSKKGLSKILEAQKRKQAFPNNS